jgi:hypothetical protein
VVRQVLERGEAGKVERVVEASELTLRERVSASIVRVCAAPTALKIVFPSFPSPYGLG